MNNKSIKVLLIEDDAEDTLLLMNLLAKSDWPSFRFTLECAEDLESGFRCLAQGEVEVVLLDLMLPDSRGIGTVSKVRSKYPDVPIVVLTGLRDEALGLEAVTHGAQDYQIKGNVDGHALKRTISYAVERHRMLTGLRNIIEGAEDGMVVIDSQGLVQYANPAAEALFNCTAAQMLGKPFPYPMPRGRSTELKIPRQSEGYRIAEMRLSEIEWKDQSASLASVRDITDLRRVEQLKAEIKERQRMDKLKDELISVVSHEMRNPLTIIKAITCSLREGLGGPLSKEQTKMVLMQHRNVLRLQKIVDDVLNLSRLESGKAEINLQRVDGVQLIHETIEGFRLLAVKHNITIRVDIPKNLPFINADPELFIQVLINLVDNALRFAKTRILIQASVLEEDAIDRAATAHKYVQISVSDDGQGIPKGRVTDLFNKFVQVNRRSKSGEYGGTGLGLAICKETLERQGGRIWVESDEGRGAQFHFLLPQYEPVLA